MAYTGGFTKKGTGFFTHFRYMKGLPGGISPVEVYERVKYIDSS